MTTVRTVERCPEPARRFGRRIAVFGALLAVLAGCAAGPPTAPDDATGTAGNPRPATTAPTAQAVPSTTTAAATAAPSDAPPPADIRSTEESSDAPPAAATTKAPRQPPTAPAPGAAAGTNPPPSITDAIKPVPGSLILPPSPPVSLVVPAIGIKASIIALGRNADGTIQVPSLDDPNAEPGWYENSPSPGTLGPAIILGHIDSRQSGPGVFYSLSDLKQGDAVDVARADGTVAMFTIDAVQTVPKSSFPTLEVYGNLNHAGLRLISCGGEFDPDALSYESNVIVFASLVGSRPA